MKEIVLRSGTGEPARVVLRLVHPPETSPQDDAEAVFQFLLDALEHQTFSLLVERIIDFRRMCGFNLLSSPSKKSQRFSINYDTQPTLFD